MDAAPPRADAADVPAPFIHVAVRNGRPVVNGDRAVLLGHRIPRPDLPIDDGVFASWEWQDGSLVVTNDRYGMRPLFYASTADGIVVSPSIRAILARGVPPALDPAAIAVFLRLHYFVGDDTPFAHIRAVPPAARFSWRAGLLEASDGRVPVRTASTMSRPDAMREFADRLAAAVGRRLPSDGAVVLPLSGGRDSRHILFALTRHGITPSVCLTLHHYPPRGNDDLAVATRLARELKLGHAVLAPVADRVGAERRKNLLTEFCSDEHAQFLPLRDYLFEHPAVVYDGIAGDTLTQRWRQPSSMAAAFARHDVDGAVAELLAVDAPRERALESMLTPAAAQQFNAALARERLRTEVARHMGTPNGANSFVFWNRTRREIALSPYALLGFLPRVLAPFLDADVFDLMMSLPAAMVLDRQFHGDTLQSAYPAWAGIPFETHTSDQEDAAYTRRLAAALLRMAARGSGFFDRRYVVSRAATAWVRGRAASLWFFPIVLWLEQIEALQSR